MSDVLYLVPKLEVTLEEIEEAMAELVATTRGEFVWTLGRSQVSLFEDGGLHVDQFAIEGEDKEEVAARLRERIAIYSPSDMPALFAAAEDDEQLDDCLRVLGLVAPPRVDERLVPLFRKGFEHSDSLVRELAVVGASVSGWPELRADIERIAKDDEDKETRETARVVLESFR